MKCLREKCKLMIIIVPRVIDFQRNNINRVYIYHIHISFTCIYYIILHLCVCMCVCRCVCMCMTAVEMIFNAITINTLCDHK